MSKVPHVDLFSHFLLDSRGGVVCVCGWMGGLIQVKLIVSSINNSRFFLCLDVSLLFKVKCRLKVQRRCSHWTLKQSTHLEMESISRRAQKMENVSSYTRVMMDSEHARTNANTKEGYSLRTLRTWTAGEVLNVGKLVSSDRT